MDRNGEIRSHSLLQKFGQYPMPSEILLTSTHQKPIMKPCHPLPCHPTPKLEGFFTYAPPTGEVAEQPDVGIVMSQCERVFVVIQIQFSNLESFISHTVAETDRRMCTLILIQSARTFASAHLLVRGGRIAVDPNMTTSMLCAS